MKNVLKIDHEKRILIMDRTFAKHAENTSSEEYAHLQEVRKDYPRYKVTLRKIKTNPDKIKYEGLTYQYMEDYIETYELPEKKDEMLAELREMIFISQCHSAAYRYPTIKKWFLSNYPGISKFKDVNAA